MILASDLATRILWREMRYSLTRRVLLDFIGSIHILRKHFFGICIPLSPSRGMFSLDSLEVP